MLFPPTTSFIIITTVPITAIAQLRHESLHNIIHPSTNHQCRIIIIRSFLQIDNDIPQLFRWRLPPLLLLLCNTLLLTLTLLRCRVLLLLLLNSTTTTTTTTAPNIIIIQVPISSTSIKLLILVTMLLLESLQSD